MAVSIVTVNIECNVMSYYRWALVGKLKTLNDTFGSRPIDTIVILQIRIYVASSGSNTRC